MPLFRNPRTTASEPKQPVFVGEIVETARCFGLRVESNLIQVAIATPDDSGIYELEIDQVVCPVESGWLTPDRAPLLVEALETLVERHHMRRHPIAVSLDGDFCVTRVTMGAPDEVDRELAMLADRVLRYLQLGPGEKVTGNARIKIDPTVDYAVTGVVNRTLIQQIYDALRSVDIEVVWVEPSLVGVARLIGQVEQWADQPVMIADGMGHHWDVGIACSGRLLLDYRPSSATSIEGLRAALDGHTSRLKRFCHRHLKMVSGELNELLICGEGDRPEEAKAALTDSIKLEPKILGVPNLPHLYRIAPADRVSCNVPAVAAVLPLLLGVAPAAVADLLVQVRRAPDLSLTQKMVRQLWPVAATIVMLCGSYGLVASERNRRSGSIEDRSQLTAEIEASRVKFSVLSRKNMLLTHFRQIEKQLNESAWGTLIDQVTHCLPDSARLNEITVDTGGGLNISGVVTDETVVYELVGTMRRLPRVNQVALKGTAPEQDSQATRFLVRLSLDQEPMTPPPGDFDE